MKEEEFKVLKALSEAAGRMDLKGFAEKVGLSPSQSLNQIQELAKEGYLQKVGSGFGISQKGKAALKVFESVPEATGFHFYYGFDQPSEFTAESLWQFYKVIKEIRVESVEFHLYRGDFQNWLKEVLKDTEAAEEFDRAKTAELKGDDLRIELLKALDAKYEVAALL